MSALLQLVLKTGKGEYKPITISINNETNKYGQNVSAWKEQTKEERAAKKKKEYVGNGRVFWTDGSINVATPKEEEKSEDDDFDLF